MLMGIIYLYNLTGTTDYLELLGCASIDKTTQN